MKVPARRVLAYAALLVLTAAVYGPALANPFAYDDITAIERNELIRDLRFVPIFFQGAPTLDGFAAGQFRPLVMASFALNYAVGGTHPFGYRLVNLLLHLADAGLLLIVLRGLLRAFARGREPRRLEEPEIFRAAWVGAALLAVHPIHSMVVLQVWKRATVMAALFSLLATWAFLRLRGIGYEAAAGRARAAWAVLLYGGLLLALASKEVAVALPALLLLLELWHQAAIPGQGGAASRARAAALWHLPLWGLAFSAVLFVYPHRSGGQLLSAASYAVTQLKVVWMYAAMALHPGLLSASYHVEVARAPDLRIAAAVLGLLALVAGVIAGRRRWPFATLAVVWTLLALAPTSSVFPIPLLVDEDRVYLPFMLLWGLAGTGLERAVAAVSERARKALVVGAGVLLVAAASSTLDRGLLWSSRPALWLDALKKHPASRPANENLCKALVGSGPPPAAAVACTLAIERFPRSVVAREGAARALIGVGKVAEAEKLLTEGLALYADEPLFHKVAGHLAWSRNQLAAAITHYRSALRSAPWDQESLVYLGLSLAETGEVGEARRIAEGFATRALSDVPDTRVRLAQLYMTAGKRDRACSLFVATQEAARAANVDGQALARLAAVCAAAARR